MNTCFDHASTPTLLLCFILITGYLLGRGSNTSFCFALRSYLVRRFRSSADTREFRKKILLQTPESSEKNPSADTREFRIPSFCTNSSSQRSFSYQAPAAWNQLLVSVRYYNSLFLSVILALSVFFKSSLKTFLFSQTFSSVPLP